MFEFLLAVRGADHSLLIEYKHLASRYREEKEEIQGSKGDFGRCSNKILVCFIRCFSFLSLLATHGR